MKIHNPPDIMVEIHRFDNRPHEPFILRDHRGLRAAFETVLSTRTRAVLQAVGDGPLMVYVQLTDDGSMLELYIRKREKPSHYHGNVKELDTAVPPEMIEDGRLERLREDAPEVIDE